MGGKATAPISEKRRLFLGAMHKAGIGVLGAITWSAYLDKAKASPLVLRPPGARREEEFLAQCIRCGLCVEACPFDTLKLANIGDQAPLGTPYFKPREIACAMCKDIPCVPVCPSGALSEMSVSRKMNDGTIKLDITLAKMGVAVVDNNQCIAFWGIQCDACYRACPLINEAIVVDMNHNDRTGKHAYLAPRVITERCTGCGLCEKACVTEKASITVLPRHVVMGKAGNNYIKGWDEADEARLATESVVPKVTVTPRSTKKAVDYLNDGEL